MQKKKLTLGNLKVNSFITEAKKPNSDTVKGGARQLISIQDPTNPTPATYCFVCDPF